MSLSKSKCWNKTIVYIFKNALLCLIQISECTSMFIERTVCYSALFTYLVRRHAGAASFPLSDVILAELACRLSDIMF